MFSKNKVNYSVAVLKVIKKKGVRDFGFFNTKELFFEVLIKVKRKTN